MILPGYVHGLYICRACTLGWESVGGRVGTCSGCGEVPEVFYEKSTYDSVTDFDIQRDKLREYLEKDRRKMEPMEELDFNPFMELIERQSEQIDELKELVEDLQNKVAELESDLADRYDALSEIKRLATPYV